MDREEIFRQINRIEQKYPVSEWRLNDINVWPLIRISLIAKLYNKKSGTDKSVGNKTNAASTGIIKSFKDKSNKYKQLFQGFLAYQKLLLRSYRKYELLFVSFKIHRQNIKGRSYNKFLDLFLKIAESRKQRALTIEFKRNDPEYDASRSFENTIVNGDNALLFHSTYLFKKNIPYSINFEQYDSFLEEITLLFGADTAGFFLQPEIVRKAKLINKIAHFYQSLFDIHKPEIIFCVSFQSLQNQGLILAGHRNKIPTVDVQHGVQGNMHEAFSNWSRVPAGGYNLLPKLFWTWDESSAGNINKWALNSGFHKAINGLNPWITYWKEKQFNKNFGLGSLFTKINNRKIILYSLQPSFDPFPEYIQQLIKETSKDFVWWLRMHPRQLSNATGINEIANELNIAENVNIQEATDLPLFLLLENCHIHVTVYSTVAFEAANYSIPTVFLDKLGEVYFKDMLPDNLVYFNSGEKEGVKKALYDAAIDKKTSDHFQPKDFEKIYLDFYENEVINSKP